MDWFEGRNLILSKLEIDIFKLYRMKTWLDIILGKRKTKGILRKNEIIK